jgi:hypothetical protein
MLRQCLQPNDNRVAVAHGCLQRLLLVLPILHQPDHMLLGQLRCMRKVLVDLRDSRSAEVNGSAVVLTGNQDSCPYTYGVQISYCCPIEMIYCCRVAAKEPIPDQP